MTSPSTGPGSSPPTRCWRITATGQSRASRVTVSRSGACTGMARGPDGSPPRPCGIARAAEYTRKDKVYLYTGIGFGRPTVQGYLGAFAATAMLLTGCGTISTEFKAISEEFEIGMVEARERLEMLHLGPAF